MLDIKTPEPHEAPAPQDMPAGVKGWSWGAFLLTPFWAIGNRTWIGLLAFIPYVSWVMAIVLGFKGREWAWMNKKWRDVEHFRSVQKRWSAWAIGIVLALITTRLFIIEPFRIPSGAMIPTLAVGDFILVSKSSYGIRLPFGYQKILETGKPQRGDVVVFRYPNDPSIDYVKRIVGLPGDYIDYKNKRLFVNGQALDYKLEGDFRYIKINGSILAKRYHENIGSNSHDILLFEDEPPVRLEVVSPSYADRKNCAYSTIGFSCTVPSGKYFMMGDNRDDSNDSRYWGFVPEHNLIGKVIVVWMSFRDFSRAGTFVN